MERYSPVVIGGVAGSGTRVYSTICELAGWNMGWWNTRQGRDCYPLPRWFYPRWTDRYVRGDLAPGELARMRREFGFWMRLCYPFRARRWGWKNPQSQYLLRFFRGIFPGMGYVHVIRDGRDQAFNPHFSYTPHQTVLMSEDEIRLDDPERKALHWQRVNERVMAEAAEVLPGRFLVSRLEDLCGDPRREVARILAYLGVESHAAREQGAAAVKTPSSLGRWRRENPETIARVEDRIGEALERYGYDVGARRS